MTVTGRPQARGIFLDVAPWDFRARNTDWRYVRYMLPRLMQFEPGLSLVLQTSKRVTLQSNYKAIRMAVGRRVGFPLAAYPRETDFLDAAELQQSNCSAVFSHRGYPLNAGERPVIWQSSILDPAMTKSFFGESEEQLLENNIRHQFFSRAAAVQVSTQAEADRLSATFPELAGRFIPIPFFLPDLTSAPEDVLERHRDPGKIEILFVGNQARRKGLDLLLNAFPKLPESTRRRVHLTIVSNFDDKSIAVPSIEGLTIHKGLPFAKVIELMRQAHVLVNVARFESYGFIFLEAMSQGAVCLGPDWEPQRELLDSGRAGVNLPVDVDALHRALLHMIEDDDARASLASAGWLRFRKRFSPEVVAAQYAQLFQRFTAA